MHKNTKNLINQKFEKLTVIEYVGKQDRREGVFWNCLCECGNKVIVHRKELSNGDSKSCGCIKVQTNYNNHWEGYEELSKDFYSSIKRNAKSRNIEFNISIEEIWNLFIKQNKKCALSNINIELTRNAKKKRSTASLDRIDSNKPYVIDNIQWVHKTVNIMKNTLSNEEFINMCKLISNNNKEVKNE
jgi:hypothetical protein